MLNIHKQNSLMVGELQGELNVDVRATVTGFDEVLAVSVVPVDVEVQVLDQAEK